MSDIIIENINKTYPARAGGKKNQVISDLSLHVRHGQTVSLLGPSGCGKTTTLRSIAGLEAPDSGKITIGDKTVFDQGVWVPPHHRKVGMVFQSYALWPHLTVFENVAYPLKQLKLKSPEIKERVAKILALVGIEHLEKRSPGQLSGGQQQRVALARSLVSAPDVILFDEPLSNLDAKLRKYMRIELNDLQERIKFTSVYVTHDRIEALNISDYIAVMSGGSILQYGTPDEIYSNPVHPFVADFIGEYNLVSAEKEIRSNRIESDFGVVHYGQVREVSDQTNDFKYSDLVFAIAPDAIEIGNFSESDTNCWEGVIQNMTFLGTTVEYIVRLGDQKINVVTLGDKRLNTGDKVQIHMPPEKIVLYRFSGAKYEEESNESLAL